MGKKKKLNKELACQLQLAAAFDGVFDTQLITSVLHEVGNDYDMALLRLTEMTKAIYDGHSQEKNSNATADSPESHVTYLHSMFPNYDLEVISMMLEECDGVVERVVEAISKSSDSAPPPPVSQDTYGDSSRTAGLSSHLNDEDICKLNSTSLPKEEHEEGDDSSPLQVMKYMLLDFMPHDEIEIFLITKDCTEHSSADHLQRVMNEILAYVSLNTTCESMTEQFSAGGDMSDNVFYSSIPENESKLKLQNFHGDSDLDILLYESSLTLGGDMCGDTTSQSQFLREGEKQFLEAKNIVRSFFKNWGTSKSGKVSVPDSMIDSALELSRVSSHPGMPGSPGYLCPDAAIGWICEELNASHPQNHSTVARSGPVSRVAGNRSKLKPTTYASKALFVPEAKMKVAIEFGGDTEKAVDSNPQFGYVAQTSCRHSSSQPLSVFSSQNGGTCFAGVNTNYQEMASYWRHVHQECKKNMLHGFSAAAHTRSKRTIACAQQFKRDMYHAAAESSKFELLMRNPNIKVVVNRGSFVEFIAFETKYTPKKVISIDMHGVDVRSGVQFVKSLVEKCHRAGNRVVVSLVVGVGNHSVRNIPKLKPAISSFLQNNAMVKLMGCVEGRIDFSVGN